MGVPGACVVGGGYGSNNVLAARHCRVFIAAIQAWRGFDECARWR